MSEEINAELIEDKRRPLQFFCWAVHLLGWVLVAAGVIWFVMFGSGGSEAALLRRGSVESMLRAMSWFVFGFMVPGLAAVGIAQFFKYLFEREGEASWLLRHGQVFLYLLAVFEIFWAFFRYGFFVMTIKDPYSRALWIQTLILPTVVKVLILVCLGQILKRILPVIEEYKSLV